LHDPPQTGSLPINGENAVFGRTRWFISYGNDLLAIVPRVRIGNLCQWPCRPEHAVMSTMNISLPEAMKRWVERQAQSGRFGNSSDYVRELIRRDQERQAKIAHMQALVDEGITSGKSTRTMKELKALARRKAGA
jgi:antitoxin ParD1/3/4